MGHLRKKHSIIDSEMKIIQNRKFWPSSDLQHKILPDLVFMSKRKALNNNVPHTCHGPESDLSFGCLGWIWKAWLEKSSRKKLSESGSFQLKYSWDDRSIFPESRVFLVDGIFMVGFFLSPERMECYRIEMNYHPCHVLSVLENVWFM